LKQQTSPSVSTNHGGGKAPMDISAIEGKGKAYKGKGKYKEERQGKSNGRYKEERQGKGYGKYKGERQGNGYGRYRGERPGKSYGRHKGEGKGKDPAGHKGEEKGYKGYGKGPVGQGNPFSMKGQQKQGHEGRRKGNQGKEAQDRCYRCGQQRHIAKHCRVSFYNYREAPTATTEQHDTTYQRHEDPHGYDNYCWHSMSHQGQQLALPAQHTLCNRENRSHVRRRLDPEHRGLPAWQQHTTHQQSRVFLEYIAMNQSWLQMYTKAMQNRQSTTVTLWSAAV